MQARTSMHAGALDRRSGLYDASKLRVQQLPGFKCLALQVASARPLLC